MGAGAHAFAWFSLSWASGTSVAPLPSEEFKETRLRTLEAGSTLRLRSGLPVGLCAVRLHTAGKVTGIEYHACVLYVP